LVIVTLLAACGSDDAVTEGSAAVSSRAPASTAAASTTAEERGQEITATSTAGTTTIGDPVCDEAQHCIYPLTVTATVSGDLTGTTVAHSAGALVGTDFAASDTLLFHGTISGCGTGTLVLLGTGRGSTTGTTTSAWTIAEGFGTGDLVAVTGSGTTSVPPVSSGSTSATLTGRITCG
jgi:hypothetical protein